MRETRKKSRWISPPTSGRRHETKKSLRLSNPAIHAIRVRRTPRIGRSRRLAAILGRQPDAIDLTRFPLEFLKERNHRGGLRLEMRMDHASTTLVAAKY